MINPPTFSPREIVSELDRFIVGEFLGSDRGLGYLMLQVQVTLDTAAMFMAVILITLIGVLLYGIVLGLERAIVVRDGC